MQAGHFGAAPFDPLSQTTDYNRQAEVLHCFLPRSATILCPFCPALSSLKNYPFQRYRAGCAHAYEVELHINSIDIMNVAQLDSGSLSRAAVPTV